MTLAVPTQGFQYDTGTALPGKELRDPQLISKRVELTDLDALHCAVLITDHYSAGDVGSDSQPQCLVRALS